LATAGFVESTAGTDAFDLLSGFDLETCRDVSTGRRLAWLWDLGGFDDPEASGFVLTSGEGLLASLRNGSVSPGGFALAAGLVLGTGF
jgi:hypothetical protein